MKNPSDYLKMRVLGAIDMAEGKTQRDRIRAVSEMTFADEAAAENIGPSPLDETLRRKIFKDMEACLQRLAAEEKLILLARRMDQVGLKELAAAFKVSHETIRRRELAGLRKMHACMTGKDWNVADLEALKS